MIEGILNLTPGSDLLQITDDTRILLAANKYQNTKEEDTNHRMRTTGSKLFVHIFLEAFPVLFIMEYRFL